MENNFTTKKEISLLLQNGSNHNYPKLHWMESYGKEV